MLVQPPSVYSGIVSADMQANIRSRAPGQKTSYHIVGTVSTPNVSVDRIFVLQRMTTNDAFNLRPDGSITCATGLLAYRGGGHGMRNVMPTAQRLACKAEALSDKMQPFRRIIRADVIREAATKASKG
jgi:hypothetical protein